MLLFYYFLRVLSCFLSHSILKIKKSFISLRILIIAYHFFYSLFFFFTIILVFVFHVPELPEEIDWSLTFLVSHFNRSLQFYL